MGLQSSRRRRDSQRLDSWKAIAEFLGRTPRTAQRWQATLGLPVHRIGGNSSSVFAFPEELDAWLRRGRGTSEADLEPVQLRAQVEVQEFPTVPQLSPDLTSTDESSRAQATLLTNHACALWSILSRNNVGRVTRIFRQAADLDPDNALAFAGLAHALVMQGLIGTLRIPEAYVSAKAAADRALALAADTEEAQSAAAWVALVLEHDWRRAHDVFGQLVQQPDPSGRVISGWGMFLIGAGRLHEAREIMYQASLRDPLIASRWARHCWADYLSGDYEQALEHVLHGRESGNRGPVLTGVEALLCLAVEKPATAIVKIGELIGEDPELPVLHGALGHAFARNGNIDQARSLLDKLAHRRPSAPQTPFYAMSLILIALGEHEEAIKTLQQSYSAGSLWSFGFHSDPVLAPLRNHPKFQAFVRHAYPLQHASSNFDERKN
jgi:Flp pilus assembly protein TadD